MGPTIVLDGVIAALLLVTVIYCWKLSRKITLLHEGKKDLAHFIQEFNIAISKAEENISQLKTLGGETDIILKDQIQKARFLANDLSFLLEKGENLADSLENYIANTRSISGIGGMQKKNPSNLRQSVTPQGRVFSPQSDNEPMKLTAEQILRTLQNNMNNQPTVPQRPGPSSSSASTMSISKKQALDNALAQIAARKNATTRETQAPISSQGISGGKTTSSSNQTADVRKLAESLKTLQRVET